MKIAVYGTLKQGHGNHILIDHCELLGQFLTLPKYTMRSFGGFPAVFKGGDTSIIVEVYEVDGETLPSVDRLESHPSWYRREIVPCLSEEVGDDVWMYIMPDEEEYEHCLIIETGEW